MRLVALFLALLFTAFTASAQQAGGPPLNTRICIVDKNRAVDGQAFQSCDAPPENNALLAKGFMIARLDRGTIKSKQPIWVHGLCRYIDNRSPTQDVLVPFGTEEEWKTFNQLVPGIMKTAGCCVPRPVSIRDIPEPPSPCIGKWTLQQVMTSNSVAQAGNAADLVPDEKMKPAGGDTLVSATNMELQFPIARDDDNTTYSIDGAREFAARWTCENSEGIATPAVAEGEEQPASHGDVLYVSFTLNCTREAWTPVILQSFCVPAETNRAYSCDVAGYAPGTPGEVIVYEKTLCPKGTTQRSLIKDTCEGEKVSAPSGAVQMTEPEAPAAPDAAPNAAQGQTQEGQQAAPAKDAKGRVNKEEKRTPP